MEQMAAYGLDGGRACPFLQTGGHVDQHVDNDLKQPPSYPLDTCVWMPTSHLWYPNSNLCERDYIFRTQ